MKIIFYLYFGIDFIDVHFFIVERKKKRKDFFQVVHLQQFFADRVENCQTNLVDSFDSVQKNIVNAPDVFIEIDKREKRKNPFGEVPTKKNCLYF